jgi:UDP-N-acetylmuramate--alanine ligase
LFITKDLPLEGVTVAVEKMLFTVLLMLELKELFIRYKTPNGILKDLRFGLPGKHNLMNALMAMQWLKYSEPHRCHCKALASLKELKDGFRIK